jgi:hypothetical protein
VVAISGKVTALSWLNFSASNRLSSWGLSDYESDYFYSYSELLSS